MRATKRRDTDAEVALRSELHRRGLRYRLDVRPAPEVRTRADILFPRARVAVFIDGCFWHGCPVHATWPKANAEWWRCKIEANRQRDAESTRLLSEAGWVVLRFWAHEAPARAASRIARVIRARGA
jgi:DNA mismatch endonuclease (patch repair protein)